RSRAATTSGNVIASGARNVDRRRGHRAPPNMPTPRRPVARQRLAQRVNGRRADRPRVVHRPRQRVEATLPDRMAGGSGAESEPTFAPTTDRPAGADHAGRRGSAGGGAALRPRAVSWRGRTSPALRRVVRNGMETRGGKVEGGLG